VSVRELGVRPNAGPIYNPPDSPFSKGGIRNAAPEFPFYKGEGIGIPPFVKGDKGGLKNEIMLFYNRKLKGHARVLRKNMTNAERLLWSKIRRKQLKGY